jgi:hypothetical protein
MYWVSEILGFFFALLNFSSGYSDIALFQPSSSFVVVD